MWPLGGGRLRGRFLPRANLPAESWCFAAVRIGVRARDAFEAHARVHRNGATHGFKHRQIREGVAVSIAFAEFETVPRGERANGPRFWFTAQVFAVNPAGPEAAGAFELGRADFELR